jgi:hypothetical protein
MRSCASLALGLLAAAASAPSANAVSLHVKLACSRDYYAHCSQFSSNSPEVRQCMRAVGDRLSSRCLDALVDAGELNANEIARRSAQLRQ